MTRVGKAKLSIAITATAIAFYQLPNLVSVASRWGMQVADPNVIGIEVKMESPWYPIVSTQSALGRILFEKAKHPMVIYHKPSLLWPWQGQLFSIVRRASATMPEEVASQRDFRWGTGRFLRSELFPGTSRYVVAPAGMQVLILTDEIAYLNAIEVLTGIGKP